MTPAAIPPAKPNLDAEIVRMRKWVEKLRGARLFRRLHIDAAMDGWANGRIVATLRDGLTEIKTVPITFHVPTMTCELLHERVCLELVACFEALVRKRLAPDTLVAPPVTVTEGLTEDARYEF